MLRAGFLVLLTIMAWSSAAIACGFADDEARYRVEHGVFGTIGEETLRLYCEDDLVIVDRTVDVDVRLLISSLYQRRAHYVEAWRDDRLIRFEGETDDNGERTTLRAEATDDPAIAITAAGASTSAPATVMPTDPWHLKLVERQALFDRKDGRVMEVTVTDAGEERLTIAGHPIDAQKFVISGKREQTLWFDQRSGFWLKSTIKHGTGDIIITRMTPILPPRLAGIGGGKQGG